MTDAYRLSGSGAPQAAPGWVDSPARPRSSCQRRGCGCSKSHCWSGMARNGRHGPQRHTCDCPAWWPSGSPSSVRGCPGQEQSRRGRGSALVLKLPMVSFFPFLPSSFSLLPSLPPSLPFFLFPFFFLSFFPSFLPSFFLPILLTVKCK